MKSELALTVLLVAMSAASTILNDKYMDVPALIVNGKALDPNNPTSLSSGGLSWIAAYKKVSNVIKEKYNGVSFDGSNDPEFKVNCDKLKPPTYPELKCVCLAIVVPDVVVGKACFYKPNKPMTTIKPIDKPTSNISTLTPIPSSPGSSPSHSSTQQPPASTMYCPPCPPCGPNRITSVKPMHFKPPKNNE